MDVPFADFFRAVHGMDPLPWQRRLADVVATRGWPGTIGVPTGLGKTACIDIAVWAMAREADRPDAERSAPTRIWYVVDRRLLIDAAHDRGEQLVTVLAAPESIRGERAAASTTDVASIQGVADGLRKIGLLGAERPPLHLVRLRGGAALGHRPPDPSQPTLAFATVAMYGSRLLFRGYGSSRSMRPIDAALAGTDALVLLDEAHIARPLVQLVTDAAACDVGDPATVLPARRCRPRLVCLTATGEDDGERFDLDAEDLAHPLVHRRIHASKPTTLVETTTKGMARSLAEEARRHAGQAEATVVFCNTAVNARKVFDELERPVHAARPLDVVLLTGRMREREADLERRGILDRAGVNHAPVKGGDRPFIVVATQTLEVGADLDFGALVTECASARALIQRFGRLNRLGDRPDANASICGASDATEIPPYDEEPTQVWDRLRRRAEPLEMSPATIADAVGPPGDAAPRVGELLPGHLWEYAKTTTPEPDEPDVELFFSGLDETRRSVSVAWRAHIPREATGDGGRGARRLLPAMRDIEAIEVPIGELRAFLEERERTSVSILSSDGTSVEEIDASRLRPGTVVVLPAATGGYDAHGWAPQSTSSVLDVGCVTWPMLPLRGANFEGIGASAPPDGGALAKAFSAADEEADDEVVGEKIVGLLDELANAEPHPALSDDQWGEYLAALRRAIGEKGDRALADAGDGVLMLDARTFAAEADAAILRADAFDDLCFDIASAALKEHLDAVGKLARKVGMEVGIGSHLVETVARAGALHDVGKADSRFQRYLGADPAAGAAMAKSAGGRNLSPSRADWPRTARHEAASARLVTVWLASHALPGVDTDLLVHLVISHHGYGRPLVRPVPEGGVAPVEVQIEGEPVEVMNDLATTDWSQPRRFRTLCERYGYWGLALLEAIVRQSDHTASAQVGRRDVRVA